MTSSINSIASRDIAPLMPKQPPQGVGEASNGPSFREMLVDSLQQVNAMQIDANKAVESVMTGGDVNPAEVLTAVQKADMAFRMMLQMRNKLVQAYQEIQNIRV